MPRPAHQPDALNEVGYVNHKGEKLVPHLMVPKKVKKPPPALADPEDRFAVKYHKGWRVEGLEPGAVEKARLQRERDILEWRTFGLGRDRVPRPPAFDAETWLRNAARHRIEHDFSVESAAEECATLAKKAGWTEVRIVELKKG